ncbi:MAG TPA: biotin/lipoyl-binding protein, partial [Polyangiaceae bacterium]|nr:biotin/lipoyl-binding protein [Polyangiaceae bacterium]
MTTTAIDDVLSSSAAALAPPTPSSQATTPKKRSLAFRLLPLLTAAALGVGTLGFIAGHGKETTDDAQIESHVASVSPRVSGQVTRVLVQDNQRVHAGDVLVELDARDFDVRLKSARADLAAATA